MNKKLIYLLLIYFFQFLVTSCVPGGDPLCRCSPAKTFEITYNSLKLTAWDTSGFQNEEISGTFSGTVNKNSFGLTVLVRSKLNQIAYLKPRLDFSSFGFASAYACSCVPPEEIIVDPIDSIIIMVTDTQTKEISDVTNNFTTNSYNGEEQITISEFFENRADGDNSFQIDMSVYDNIPDYSIFTVKIILESGIEFVEQTQEINFQ